MNANVKQALDHALSHWKSMAASEQEESESTAEQFEASFYALIDAIRAWYDELEEQPGALDQFLDLPMIQDIMNQLPSPLVLNFETEAEFIVDHIVRMDEDKYD
ncbi:hypothetical protein BVG16_24360 [Paenibacillus selenitireducens]|uniref:Uncharacterized protein n=1 Tax=Paenibacillus selenitireducens TaxID=1324314 RepID=A0A1T2X3W1_9BACL|nr:hypothetical protein [Paenibacillus selenitireducens]OPA74263.1 hypothetical protein BVG16_24360 [Paenibacillus selenitireducens]